MAPPPLAASGRGGQNSPLITVVSINAVVLPPTLAIIELCPEAIIICNTVVSSIIIHRLMCYITLFSYSAALV